MANYGKIMSYDGEEGIGTIVPEMGGDALAFRKSDLQQQAQEPKVDQRYGYEIKQVDGGQARAVNLQMEQESRDQDETQQI